MSKYPPMAQSPSLPTVQLRKGLERRCLRGHDWVFSNEIKASPALAQLKPGQLVSIVTHQGKFLATALYNPRTLIAARIIDRRPVTDLSCDWFSRRIAEAIRVREQIYPHPFYRAIYGESDGLPGLVADRYGDVWVCQITTAGMERSRDAIQSVLQDSYQLRGLVWRADDHFRELEGLGKGSGEVIGDVPELIEVREGDLNFQTNVAAGQKTGWFFDQRDNRLRLHKYASGKNVLDVFAYAGAWAIHALRAGARSAACVDASQSALDLARQNAKLNQVELETQCGDAFELMKQMIRDQRRFEIAIVDPPALIKRKKDYDAGLQAYYQLARLGTQLVAPEGGLLVACSCSQHLSEDDLLQTIRHAAMTFGRRARILEFGSQSADHPVHPCMPETRYLKAFFVWLSSAD